MPNNSKKRIAVIGGGLTGLSHAYQLSKTNANIDLFEQSHRLGGIIKSTQLVDSHGSFVLEHGPDSFLPKTPKILHLIDDLKLNDQLIKVNSEHRSSYVYVNKKIHPTPKAYYLLAPKKMKPFMRCSALSLKGKLRVLMEPFYPKSKLTDESFYDFVTRRFGHENFTNIAQAMVSGIYGANPKKLSIHATLPLFPYLEQTYGSVLHGLRHHSRKDSSSGARYGMFYSFKSGMEYLIHQLQKKLNKKINIQLNTEAVSLKQNSDQSWNLQYEYKNKSQTKTYDDIYICTHLKSAAHILKDINNNLNKNLNSISCNSSIVVNLVYSKPHMTNETLFPHGAGMVIPDKESKAIVAVSFLSQKFKHRCDDKHSIVRVFLGAHNRQEQMQLTESQIIDLCHQELRSIFNINQDSLLQRVQKWPNAMPQYHVGHTQKVKKIQDTIKQYPGLHVYGNYLKGVGLSDCVI